MNKKYCFSEIILCLLASTSLAQAASAAPLKVVASFSIIADFAANVGGGRIELTTLVGPNGDAHVYEPKPADAVAMSKAEIILVNGLQFEGFLPRLIQASGTKAPVVELTRGGQILKQELAGDVSQDDGELDPHAWQSISNAKVYVKNITAAFCAADKAGCEKYQTNSAGYLASLEALDLDIKAMFANIPTEKRVVISSHDAFGYFAKAYGLKFLAPEGIATQSEASAADIAALILQIRLEKASALFVENISDPRLVEQISRETSIKIGGALFSDALSDANGPAATYLEMMRHNAVALKSAISGS